MAVPIDEPVVVAGVANPNGYRVVSIKEKLAQKKKRNKSPKSREEIERALRGREGIAALSAEIRKRAGLGPLAERDQTKAWRRSLESMPAPKAKRKASVKSQAEMSPADRVAAVARRRREIEREREALDAEVRALVSEPTVSVVSIAKALGVSRQRVYQLASA